MYGFFFIHVQQLKKIHPCTKGVRFLWYWAGLLFFLNEEYECYRVFGIPLPSYPIGTGERIINYNFDLTHWKNNSHARRAFFSRPSRHFDCEINIITCRLPTSLWSKKMYVYGGQSDISLTMCQYLIILTNMNRMLPLFQIAINKDL